MRGPVTFDAVDRRGNGRDGVEVDVRELASDGTIASTPADAWVSEEGAAAPVPRLTDATGQRALWLEAGAYVWRIVDGALASPYEPVVVVSREIALGGGMDEEIAALAARVDVLEGNAAGMADALAALTAAVATDDELAAAVAVLEAALDASGATSAADLAAAVATINAAMATDSELAAAVASLVSAIALKQDAATAATDSELAAQIAIVTSALSDLEGVVATDAELAAAFDALSASMATDAEVAALLTPIVSGLAAHVADDAIDGGPHGLPALPANGQVWARVAGELAAFDLDGALEDAKARASHTGTQAAATISDFTEAVQDAVAALLGAGSNVTLFYDDAADTLTITSSDSDTTDPEAVRDAIGIALVGAGLISVGVNDGADTITISTTATANATDAQLRDRALHTGAQAIATVTGLQAALDLLTPMSRTITAGAGLTGGGDLSANRSLAADFGTGAGKVVQGNDAALTDNRTPLDGSVTAAKVNAALKPSGTAVDATEALRALGTSAGQAAPGTSLAGLVTLAPATSARNIVQPSADVVALVLKGSAGQTADVWQSQTSAGVVNASVSATGALGVSKATVTGAADVVQLAVIGNSSQSARVMQVLSSGAVEWFAIGNTGRIASIGADVTPTSTSVNAIVATSAASASVATMVVKAGASQAANLHEWQNSAGAALLYVNAAGALITQSAQIAVGLLSRSALELGAVQTIKWTANNGVGSGTLDTSIARASAGVLGMSSGLITASAAATIGLVVKGAASQSANYQEWQNSAGTVEAQMRVGGDLTIRDIACRYVTASAVARINGAGNYGSGLSVLADPTLGGIIVRGGASQTGDLFQAQNSAGTVLASVDSAGHFVAPAGTAGGLYAATTADTRLIQTSAGAFIRTANAGGNFYVDNDFFFGKRVVTRSGSAPVGGITAYALGTSEVNLVVKASASQSANLQEWQDSAGNQLGYINNAGGMLLSGSMNSNTVQLGTSAASIARNTGTGAITYNAQPIAAGTHTFLLTHASQSVIIKGAASQSANLQEWQDSTGAIQAGVTPAGVLRLGGQFNLIYQAAGTHNKIVSGIGDLGIYQINGTAVRVYNNSTGYYASVMSIAASAHTLALLAAPAQTADLQQHKDSAGTVMASVTSAGLLKWSAAGNEQLTVGVLGAAAGVPALPTKYLKVVDSAGTTLVIPAYAAA